MNQLLLSHSISLNQTKNNIIGRTKEDTKVEATRKMVIHKKTDTLFLQNNELRSLTGLSTVLTDVMWDSRNLLWLDISYNYLEQIDTELMNFPTLKTLYLHGNYIANLEEVRKLQGLPNLMNLTLFGNPIEQVKGYRMWVLGVMYGNGSEMLRKFD